MEEYYSVHLKSLAGISLQDTNTLSWVPFSEIAHLEIPSSLYIPDHISSHIACSNPNY